ncbi:MAG: hypothetical protein KAS69_05345, partial [Planctomycetes bacterium]|nr:hypothetical protein [Planctomycetota bacterium]
MYDYENKQNEPVCKFGPGGDFISGLLPKIEKTNPHSASHLTRLLKSICEMTSTLLSSDSYCDLANTAETKT